MIGKNHSSNSHARVDPTRSNPGRCLITAAAAAADALTAALRTSIPSDVRFDGYRCVEEVSRGGQGVVYRAIQNDTGREVAIKVLLGGPSGSARGHARFSREVRILGRLQHPNIVTIHGSGESAGCRHYVMDYIRGASLDAYVGRAGRPIHATVRLFARICDAVSEAHAHGIVHRDLKPSNIRVDDGGEPHILDFGLAKPLDAPGGGARSLDLHSLPDVTVEGQFLGSLPWAAPEQVGGSDGDVDERTDVYSLGLLLYHSLLGRFPYDVSGALPVIVSNILECNPLRPTAIRPDLPSDIETILLKCLEKPKTRRYRDAAALGADLRLWLNNEPIMARAPTTAYLLSKLVRRHRIFAAMLMVVLVLVAVFTVWTGILYQRADASRVNAVAAESVAQQRQKEAEREAAATRAINDFLLNGILAAASPEVAQGRAVTIGEALDIAAAKIDGAFAGQPEIEASVRKTLGTSYMGLGKYAEAEVHLRAAQRLYAGTLSDSTREWVQVSVALTFSLRRQDKLSEADPLSAEVLDRSTRELGESDPETLRAASERAAVVLLLGRPTEAIELHKQTLDRRRIVLGDDHEETLATLSMLGVTWQWGNSGAAGAVDLFKRGLQTARQKLTPDHPISIALLSDVGTILAHERRFTEAETMLRECVSRSERVLGPDHSDTLMAKSRLGVALYELGRADDGIRILRECVDAAARNFSERHPAWHGSAILLAQALMRRGYYSAAAETYDHIHAIRQEAYGDAHEGTAACIDGFATALRRLGHVERSVQLHRAALAVYRAGPTDLDRTPVFCLRGLRDALAALGQAEEARPFSEELLASYRKAAETPGASAYVLNCYAREFLEAEPHDLRDPQKAIEIGERAVAASEESYAYSRYTLARAYDAAGQSEKALRMARRAVENTPAAASGERDDFEDLLARLLVAAGDADAAEQIYRDTLIARRETASTEVDGICLALERLATVLLKRAKFQEAESLLRESLALQEADPPYEAWRTAETLGLLGECLMLAGNPAEAEPLLERSHEILTEHKFAPLQRLQAAEQRLQKLGTMSLIQRD